MAPVAVAAAASDDQQAWLDALWTSIVERKVTDDLYYSNTIKMMVLLALADLWPAT